ncbi:hypothetical protein [Sphaerimonospora mesophila]|uniref:hypothetical protein n=1 Tax=Sphaerimonospora mesophila TaxID=37483 RepID=UPI0006E2DCAC
MTRGIQRLADRMLARFVPETKAAASECGTEGSGTCLVRYCCWGGGVPNGKLCGPWQYTC